MVTQEDVATHAGVSRSVVSYVLNNGPRSVSDETRQRVLAAIQELGYRPNRHAQQLRAGDGFARNSIGIVIGGKSYNLLERSYYNTVLAGLFYNAHTLNQHIRFFTFFEALKDPVFFNKNIHREEISSLLILLPTLILNDPEHKTIFPQIIERMGNNILCLERSIYDLPALVIDLARAAQMAVEHLVKLGHCQIGFLALSDEQRGVGYRRALEAHDLPFTTDLTRRVDAEHLFTSAYDLAAELLEANPTMSAICAANDDIAIATLAATHDHGLKVPEDISVVSIDDINLASMVRPALTTVKIPIQGMGGYAISLLTSLETTATAQPFLENLPLELIVRESTGIRNR